VSTYRDALDRLLATPTLPKLGLERMSALCAALGNPQLQYTTLHVAGTKGKGSTCAIAASMLRAAGLRVGLTTSPHLLCARERIVIDDAMIDEATFASLAARVEVAAQTLPAELETPSFFERLTAMAFCAFADARVDVAVVEVGLGGRLDATNVVQPVACAITRLGLDHTEFLGPTLVHIAREKAGIIKRGVPAVTAPQQPEALAVLQQQAHVQQATLQVVEVGHAPPTNLRGAHQEENAAVAAALVRCSGLVLDDRLLTRGAKQATWPARYETVCAQPLVIIDGAHDGIAAEALGHTLCNDERLQNRPLHLVVGMSSGHEPDEVLLPLLAVGWTSATATRAEHPRALLVDDVVTALRRTLGQGKGVDVVSSALDTAMVQARADGGAVVVTGSLFVAGEARGLFFAMPADQQRPRY
jgi:dihydrofolate synthase/folylpolyglutamate synthase